LSKEQIAELYSMAEKIIKNWVEIENNLLSPENRYREYTLDMEFKVVPHLWLKNLSPQGDKTIVIKQARPLMKLNRLSTELAKLPAPRDFLYEATHILRRVFEGSRVRFETTEIYKAQTAHDDAFNVEVKFDFKSPVAKFRTGDKLNLNHTEIIDANHGFMHHGPWDLTFKNAPHVEAKSGAFAFTGYEHGLRIYIDDQALEDSGEMQVTDLLITPQLWAQEFVLRNKPQDPGGDVGIGIGIGIGKPPRFGGGGPGMKPGNGPKFKLQPILKPNGI
jgi:hypothetical protein